MNLIEMKVRNQKITNMGTLTTTPGMFKMVPNTPGIIELNPNTITVEDLCAGCPWNQKNLFGTAKPYIGDSPCQWCEHGPKLTCEGTTYCTDVMNLNNVVGADPDYPEEAIANTEEVIVEQPKEKPVQVFKPIKKKK